MRMHKAKAHKKVLPDNTIPLINIVFLMLIFFLIAGTIAPPVSSALNPTQSQDLPQTSPAQDALEILKDGTLVYHGNMLTLDEAIARFSSEDIAPNDERGSVAAKQNDQDKIVHVLADRELPSSKLMPILQALRAAGHKSIRLVTLREGA